MVTDKQVRILMKQKTQGKTLKLAAAMAGMSEKTGRTYLQTGRLPSQCAVAHTWKTYPDAFADDWPWVSEQLELNPGLEAKSLFEALQRLSPGKYADGQLRTFQRRVKFWRALHGASKEIFFPQEYRPGEWAESDFTWMNELGITIAGQPFEHMLYHFVLPYSNWETGTICFSESYESLSAGLQNALWKLGGVPRHHRTDRLSSAVNKVGNPQEFTESYQGLARHYGFSTSAIQAGKPNEQGDVEQSHNRLKRLFEQSLLLRGSREFASIEEYEHFLQQMFDRRNAGRSVQLKEEMDVLRQLPPRRLEDYRRFECRVNQFATIRLLHNTYSVHGRLRDEQIQARVYADHIEVWYAQQFVECLPRLRGENKHRIDYRHIIDQLVRKPGAFENYRYKQDMFPTSYFRIAYDLLRSYHGAKQGTKEYLKLLELAAGEGEQTVNEILRLCIDHDREFTSDQVRELVAEGNEPPSVLELAVEPVDIAAYDELLEAVEALV